MFSRRLSTVLFWKFYIINGLSCLCSIKFDLWHNRALLEQKRCVRSVFGLWLRVSLRGGFSQSKMLTELGLYFLESVLFIKEVQIYFKIFRISINMIQEKIITFKLHCINTTNCKRMWTFHWDLQIGSKERLTRG